MSVHTYREVPRVAATVTPRPPLLHRVVHWFGRNRGTVEAWSHADVVMVGFRCAGCGKLEQVSVASPYPLANLVTFGEAARDAVAAVRKARGLP